jgi:multimeric flavodoxin WrbA
VVELLYAKRGNNLNTALIIHDLNFEQAQYLFYDLNDAEILSSHKKAAPCVGCYRCWTKTPGSCVYHDGIEDIGRKIALHSSLVIVSKIIYGSYSPSIKNMLDRSISTSLPSFTFRGGKMHHKLRYQNRYDLKVCFYNFDSSCEISHEEKAIANNLVAANSVNWDCSKHEIFFADNFEELRGMLK